MIGGCAERHSDGISAERHIDGINIQRVWCLRPLFLVLGYYTEEGVGSDLSA